jgi:hypothetical protein
MNIRKRINCLFGLHEPMTEITKSYFSTHILTTCKHCGEFIAHSSTINYDHLIINTPMIDIDYCKIKSKEVTAPPEL